MKPSTFDFSESSFVTAVTFIPHVCFVQTCENARGGHFHTMATAAISDVIITYPDGTSEKRTPIGPATCKQALDMSRR